MEKDIKETPLSVKGTTIDINTNSPSNNETKISLPPLKKSFAKKEEEKNEKDDVLEEEGEEEEELKKKDSKTDLDKSSDSSKITQKEEKTKREEQNDDSSDVKLKFIHGLGIKKNRTKTVFHLEDDEQIIYQLGQHIVIYDYEKFSHKFLLKSPKVDEIVSFAVSNGRNHIALNEIMTSPEKKLKSKNNLKKLSSKSQESEKGLQNITETGAVTTIVERMPDITEQQISIYNLDKAKRVKTLKLECGVKSIVTSMDFSRSSKFFVCATSTPENGVYCWNLEKNKKIGFVRVAKFESLELKLDPFSSDFVLISGISQSEIKFFRFEENELKHFDVNLSAFNQNNSLNTYLENLTMKNNPNNIKSQVESSSGPNSFGVEEITSSNLTGMSPSLMGSINLTEQQALSGGKAMQNVFLTHEWFEDEGMLVGTSMGDIIVIQKLKIAKVLVKVFPNYSSVNSICAIERGFICGGNNGFFAVYERSYDKNIFNLYKLFQTNDKVKIVDFCVSKHEENCVIVNDQTNVLLFPLNNVDILKESESFLNFKSLSIGFHCDIVESVDSAYQKPLIVTVSRDNTLRMFNYSKKTVEMNYSFNNKMINVNNFTTFDVNSNNNINNNDLDDVYSVSISPNGLLLLVGFRFKLCLYAIISSTSNLVSSNVNVNQSHVNQNVNNQNDSLLKLCEWMFKGCRCIKFSNGGHLFAAAVSSNILIVSTVSFKPIQTLHAHNSVVKDMHFSPNDLNLVSCAFDGSLIVWDIFNSEKPVKMESMVKNVNFHSCFYDHENIICGAIGNDKRIWIFDDVIEVSVLTDHILTCFCLSLVHNCLFIGTHTGLVLVYSWPFIKKNAINNKSNNNNINSGNNNNAMPLIGRKVTNIDNSENLAQNNNLFVNLMRTYSVHRGKIIKLIMSKDQQYLFCVGEDNSLIISSIISLLENTRKYPINTQSNNINTQNNTQNISKIIPDFKNETTKNDQKIEELTFILKSTLTEYTNSMLNLREKMHQIISETERQINLNNNEKMKMIESTKNTYKVKIDNLKNELSVNQQKFLEKELNYKKNFENLEKKSKNLIFEFNKNIEKKFQIDAIKNEKVQNELKNEISTLQDSILNIENEHRINVEHIKNEYLKDKVEQIKSFNQLGIELEEKNEIFKEEKRQMNEINNQINENLKIEFDKKVEDLKKKESHAMKQAMIYKSDIKTLKVKLDDSILKIENLKSEKKKRIEQINELEKEKKMLKEEIKEKESQIQNNEKTIMDQKMEISELEKLRYVLTFKYNSLQKDVSPKELLLNELKKQLKGMDNELNKVRKEKEVLLNKSKGNTEALQVSKKNVSKLSTKVDLRNRVVQMFCNEMNQILYSYNEPEKIVENTKTLLEEFINKCNVEGNFDNNEKDENNSNSNPLARFTKSKNTKIDEFERQRMHLEQKLDGLKDTLEKKERNLKGEVNRKQLENSVLVNEVNLLTREKKFLEKTVKDLENKLKLNSTQ